MNFGDWRCECSQVNELKTTECVNCKKTKPVYSSRIHKNEEDYSQKAVEEREETKVLDSDLPIQNTEDYIKAEQYNCCYMQGKPPLSNSQHGNI
mmetsp:Transcript_3134/g.2702  ORF Transcript_3134/g.2702 Transcript_3134/m.2702 type:complete len:94 (+) Transcript_3134:1286-1567(+)